MVRVEFQKGEGEGQRTRAFDLRHMSHVDGAPGDPEQLSSVSINGIANFLGNVRTVTFNTPAGSDTIIVKNWDLIRVTGGN